MTSLDSILIIDDNEGDRFIAQKMVQRAGICNRIFQTTDGAEALDFLCNFDQGKSVYGENFPPSLILVDINMPRMNGFEFLTEFEKLTGDDRYSSVTVMMFSSSENEQDRARVSSFKFVKGFIVKPLSVRKLLENLSRSATTA